MSVELLQPFSAELDGEVFVEASAGTGKTYAIEMVYLRLLVESGLDPEQIVVVTYTNAAAAELRDRIRSRIRDAHAVLAGGEGADEPWVDFVLGCGDRAQTERRLLSALFGFDRAAISTIHGFCQRVLVEHAFESGVRFDLKLIADQAAVVDQVVRDFVADRLSGQLRGLTDAVWGGGSLADYQRFASLVAAQPELEVVPAVRGYQAQLDTWQESLERACDLWSADRETILELRTNHPALNKRAALAADAMAGGLDRAFAATGPFAGKRWRGVAGMTPEFLSARTYKKFQGETPQHPFFDSCAGLLAAEAELETAFRCSLFADFASFARREVPSRKAAQAEVYFDDLLLGLRDALRSGRGERLASKLRGRFAAALIDEFQDTDPVQYDIFDRVFGQGAAGDRPLVLIGDPKQSIYSFRGADVATYVAAGRSARRSYGLTVNRRSSASLVRGVNALFSPPDVFLADGIDFRPAESLSSVPEIDGGPGGLTVLRCAPPAAGGNVAAYRAAVCRGVASRIVALLNSAASLGDDPLRAGDVAVLCRSNREAIAIQRELRERSVPTVLQGDRSVFETDEAQEVGRVLRALVDPRDPGLLRAAMSTGFCGVDADGLLAAEADEAWWQEWVDRFRRCRRRWDEHGFMSGFRSLLDESATMARLLGSDGGERRLTNYLHLGELVQVASRRLRCGPRGVADWLSLMVEDAAARGDVAADEMQVRLESDENAVVLTTIHKSKGLEYPVVFAPFLWCSVRLHESDKTFPKQSEASGRRSIYVGRPVPDEVRDRAKRDVLAEEMRLAYVALTRAKHACFVVATDAMDTQMSPLGRLLDDNELAASAVRFESLGESAECLRAQPSAEPVVEPPLPPSVASGWRVSSFSSLTRRDETLTAEEFEGVDRDPREAYAAVADGAAADQVPLADFPSGTKVGVMVHSVLEHLDFANADVASVRGTIAGESAASTLTTGQVDTLAEALSEVLAAPLAGAGGFSLTDIERNRRLDELEFILPVADGGASRVTPARLAAVVERYDSVFVPGYAERVAGLGFSAFAGFLRGFVDLVFRHEGRWYVVDYKSNHLGRRWQDYADQRLAEEMAHHHYYLQYLLYVVATDRYLRHRVEGYGYETHFGGVLYLFLRGMSSQRVGSGVFADRPPAELIAELSELFDGNGADV